MPQRIEPPERATDTLVARDARSVPSRPMSKKRRNRTAITPPAHAFATRSDARTDGNAGPPVPTARPDLPRLDMQAIHGRVATALDKAGNDPCLVGFEAVGIQELIAANGRPLAMQGASKLVDDFDEANRSEAPSAGGGGIIFAGGGRGLRVVSTAGAATAIAELRRRYAETTCGGQLAVAMAPLDVAKPAASLRWLRLRLDGAKDRAEAPRVPVPPTHEGRCTDCKIREIDGTYAGPEGPVPACTLCARVVERGKRSAKQRWTLEDLATEGSIAVVSADGNNLGALFAGLEDLAQNAACSELVRAIFMRAHTLALPGDGRYVDPVVGGDDIRVFLPPEHLLGYVTRLAGEVDALSRAAVADDRLPAVITQGLSKLGVGVGAVIAPYHFPASRLIDMAHELEDSAKKACLRHGHRSAFDFSWLRSGQELSQGLEALGEGNRPDALPLGSEPWERYLAKARALRKVSSSQRSMLIQHDPRPHDDAELANLYRYQVVRHAEWKQWFEDCGVDWRDAAALASNLPDRRLSDVADLLALAAKGASR